MLTGLPYVMFREMAIRLQTLNVSRDSVIKPEGGIVIVYDGNLQGFKIC
jgi:hypothetical protein